MPIPLGMWERRTLRFDTDNKDEAEGFQPTSLIEFSI